MTIARVTVTSDRPGVDLFMYEGAGPVISPVWTLGGSRLTFLRLDADQSYELDTGDDQVYVKVITGRLSAPSRVAYIASRSIADTHVAGNRLTAGPQGALVAILMRSPDAPERFTDMTQLVIHGPLEEHLRWSTFEQRFAGRIPHFDGLDAHLTPGFHLLATNGSEIAYVYVWTAGKGVDMSTHNHGHRPGPLNPAFAEVHWVLANGTGEGGMYETSAPGAPDRERLIVPTGFEHGPYFEVNESGLPALRDNGAVVYPWHSWQGGDDDEPGPAYDVVIPFEITVPYAVVTEV
jgi:hypothetical protein